MPSSLLERRWYSAAPAPWWLRPLAALYGWIAQRRRARLASSAPALPVPVIIVGNISVGGTGKTPFTLWLVERLREWGWRPGIISRGYGGSAPQYPCAVDAQTDPAVSGDEPALMARRLGVPVVVAPDRVAAARHLLADHPVNVLVSDDGLQHYRLARNLEFCVVDGARGLGNGALLPAGPLRELPTRLREVDAVIVNGQGWVPEGVSPLHMRLELQQALRLQDGHPQPLVEWAGQTVHAVAGIGHPQRFFDQLTALGLRVIPHAFADHHAYSAGDLAFEDASAVLMTEKDAVKCIAFAQPHWWSVPVEAAFSEADTARIRNLIGKLNS